MIEELKSWYTYFVETGDDVKIHSELQAITYRIVRTPVLHPAVRAHPLTHSPAVSI